MPVAAAAVDQRDAYSGDGSPSPRWRARGCYYAIGKPGNVMCIGEGFATCATAHEDTGHPIASAFNANNLLAVARAMRSKLPHATIVMLADDDIWTEGNPGLTKAREAAKAVGGVVAVPDFGPNRPDRATDFNDLHRHAGAEAVHRIIEAAIRDSKEAQRKVTEEREATQTPGRRIRPCLTCATGPADPPG